MHADSVNRLRAAADHHTAAMVAFAQRLIQTRSLPGEEGDIARVSLDEMKRIGYDDVWADGAGNVIGAIRGTGDGPSVQFNAHLDHVSAGDEALWARPPFAGIIEGDTLYGRGASDVKGAMATQVYLAPVLRAAGCLPRGDVFFAGVVLEEVGGFGSAFLAREMPTTYAVLAEATNNQVNRGHRGRLLIRATFTGLSAHASAPQRARNPHFAAARFLLAVEHLELPAHPTFKGSTVAPTLAEVDQTSSNVTPGTVTIYLDWRSIPGESEHDVIGRLSPLAERAAAEVPGVSVSLEAVGRPVKTYTGLDAVMPPTRGFETPADHPLVTSSVAALSGALSRPVEIGTWTFATDGGHLHHHGITTIGFAPGEERFAHTIHDQVSIAKMREALFGNAVLALTITDLAPTESR